MDSVGTVLIVSALSSDWSALEDVLVRKYDYRILNARSRAEAIETLAAVHVDLALVEDMGMGDGLSLLTDLRVSHPDIIRVPVIDPKRPPAASAMPPAAIYQFLRKPLDAEQAALVVKRALEARELARRHRLLSREFKIADDSISHHVHHAFRLPPESQRFEKLVFVSEKMADVCNLARRAAKTELPILVQGDTGTGKELLARAIHYNSSRRASPLMVQNCGGMQDQLLQSELFGHKRGAYTGAVSDRLGLFRAADGGTIFLDEISDVSPSFQISLLRFLQEGEVKPLGSDRTEKSNVRIIAASNRPLNALVAKGEFRRDLYFRLKGFELEVPPLRDRPDDIPALAEFFAAKHSDAMSRKIIGISASVLAKFLAYDFPGNVRELENEIRRMVALAKDGEYLTTQNLSPAIMAAQPSRPSPANGHAAQGKTLKEKVENLEKQIVGDVLLRHRWNQSRAADELGLSRVGLANKIKRYGLNEAH